MKKYLFFIYSINYLFIYSYEKSFEIKVLDKNKRTNLGKIYFDKI